MRLKLRFWRLQFLGQRVRENIFGSTSGEENIQIYHEHAALLIHCLSLLILLYIILSFFNFSLFLSLSFFHLLSLPPSLPFFLPSFLGMVINFENLSVYYLPLHLMVFIGQQWIESNLRSQDTQWAKRRLWVWNQKHSLINLVHF